MYKVIADINTDSGITARSSFDSMRIAAGGVKELGFTHKDLKNHIHRRKRKMLQHVAAEFLLNYVNDQKPFNKGFFSKIKVDNAQIKIGFWATAHMRMDYQCFRNCVNFDTTYRTNDENRPLALFVGKINHEKLCVFGAALLLDETIPTFEWLFQTFLEYMEQKYLISIFSDQAAAIAAGIRTNLPDTYHDLCNFHILQKRAKKSWKKVHVCNSKVP
ncbi:Protein FAR1-RELATED SEQUENCE 5 [Linum grandiflorum]